ncbi:MAG: AMP-binding protein [Azospirillaceae bacterium]|nr:AMP-binding protein [Azospirillaceae bacterium]
MISSATDWLDPTCGGLFPRIPDREPAPAIRDADTPEWLSRAALREQVMRLATTLSPGSASLAFVIGDNRIATVSAILAARAAGHAVALIGPDLSPIRLRRLIDDYQPEIVLSAAGCPGGDGLERYASSKMAAGLRSRIGDGGPRHWRRLRRSGNPVHPALAILLSTSGTTGSAKFVRLSETAIMVNAGQIAKALAIDPDDVAIAHLPVSHSYGLSVITSHLRVGAAVYLTGESVVRPAFWAAVRAVGGTHFPGVPFHYNFLARSGLDRLVPETVRTLTQAGGALDGRIQQQMHDFVERRGDRFYVMYGQTEAGPRMTTLAHDQFVQKRGSVGRALDWAALRIEDADHKALAPGQEGHVVFQGPNVMLGYAERRLDLSKGDETGGRLDTGDLGRLDSEGFLTITGRSKRMATLAGLRISLDEVESRLRETATAAVLDDGDRIVVFCEDPALIKGTVAALSGEWRLPGASFDVRGVPRLPFCDSGKIDYERLRVLI